MGPAWQARGSSRGHISVRAHLKRSPPILPRGFWAAPPSLPASGPESRRSWQRFEPDANSGQDLRAPIGDSRSGPLQGSAFTEQSGIAIDPSAFHVSLKGPEKGSVSWRPGARLGLGPNCICLPTPWCASIMCSRHAKGDAMSFDAWRLRARATAPRFTGRARCWGSA